MGPDYGVVTSCPTNIGTGMRASVHISPSARFCISEAEIVTALYKGVELLKAEEDNAFDAVKTIMALKKDWPENIAVQTFDKAYYDSLPQEKQARFMKCLMSGIKNPDSGMGCYACQPSDYDEFKPFFAKAIAKYHKVPEGAKHVNNW